MSEAMQPQLGLQEIANALGRLRHLQEKIEGVWQDFFGEESGLLPREVAHVHLQRATEALDQQIEKALILAFGDDSLPLHQFRAVGFLPTSPQSLVDVQWLLDSMIFDLQQRRLELLRSSANSPQPAPVIDHF